MILLDTGCFSKNKISPKFKRILYGKIVLSVLIAIGSLLACIVITNTANKIDGEEIKYYHEKQCFVDYLQEEMDKFYKLLVQLKVRLIVLLIFTCIQIVIEGGAYPFLKAFDKWRQAKYRRQREAAGLPPTEKQNHDASAVGQQFVDGPETIQGGH